MVVTFKISDQGKALELEDLDPNSVKFTVAALKTGKVNATMPTIFSPKLPQRLHLQGRRRSPLAEDPAARR
jgi:hypothetical protein